MKTIRLVRPLQTSHLAVCLLFAAAGSSFAQSGSGSGSGSGLGSVSCANNAIIPAVTIQAIHTNATWGGTPGVFRVFRAGNPAPDLNVYYDLGGTAINGTDYQLISHWVEIPSGVAFNDIVIKPINKGQLLTKTVTLTLTNSDSATPINYQICSPSSATLDIKPGPSNNIPPEVSICYPTNGATFYTNINLPIVAFAKDLDGVVVSVEFFENGVSLGIVSNTPSPIILPATPTPMTATPPIPIFRPFVLIWTNVPPGTNIVLTAKATDNGGALHSLRSGEHHRASRPRADSAAAHEPAAGGAHYQPGERR